tara:strand:+ start:188 stop:349 length:162 start_codon:yes stop_codon:yes gene_type:complete
MSKEKKKTDVDRVDQLLGVAIFVLMVIAVFCIVVYSVGSLSDIVFDLLYPEKY